MNIIISEFPLPRFWLIPSLLEEKETNTFLIIKITQIPAIKKKKGLNHSLCQITVTIHCNQWYDMFSTLLYYPRCKGWRKVWGHISSSGQVSVRQGAGVFVNWNCTIVVATAVKQPDLLLMQTKCVKKICNNYIIIKNNVNKRIVQPFRTHVVSLNCCYTLGESSTSLDKIVSAT